MRRLESLVALCHHRWSVPILAELHRDQGCKLVTLAVRLHASRPAIRQTLDALIEHGWVKRNPGYGHPLRPEFILTAAGERVGAACVDLMATLRALKLEEAALRKWSLPVLAALRGGARFSELVASLPGVTGRALSQALKTLQQEGLVERRVLDGHPPTSVYAPTPDGKRLAPLLPRP